MWTSACVWLCCALTVASGKKQEEKIFTNMWLAEIHGGEDVAERVARTLGFTFHGQASHFEDHYVLTRDDQPELSESHSNHLTRDLLDFDEVKWAKQQQIVERTVGSDGGDWDKLYEDSQEIKLMDYLKAADSQHIAPSSWGNAFFSQITFPSDIMNFLRRIGDFNVKKLGSFPTTPLDQSFLWQNPGVTKHVECKTRKVSAYALRFNDPYWRRQWYVQDYRTELMPVMDHNVVPVYDMGYTGASVKVAVLDDGLQESHPDIEANVQKSLCYDICKDKPGSLPEKKTGIWSTVTDPHGTKCAGVIAMVANNKMCGVGIAYGARVAGVRMLCKSLVEYKEAKALSHAYDKFDIYSSSWTPPDEGHYMCILDKMVEEAYIKGTTKGRNGKGVVYVQAAGNGRGNGNNCASNCFINNPYVIGITSANQLGKAAYYSDRCTAIFATAYSGSIGMEGVSTLSADGGCWKSFSGTSAATPIAAGIIALVLESKPGLTYRDVMHLIAMTAEVAPLANNDRWYKNGRGLWVSNEFGFGLLNAANMVVLAKDWKKVPDKHTCIFTHTLDYPKKFRPGGPIVEISFTTDACHGKSNAVNYLEQIEMTAEVEFPVRGALSVGLISPAETRSVFLELRPYDMFVMSGLSGWNFMSVHNWGEDPKGLWTLAVVAAPYINSDGVEGVIHSVTLKFHGTAEEPDHYKNRRIYSAFRLPNGDTSES